LKGQIDGLHSDQSSDRPATVCSVDRCKNGKIAAALVAWLDEDCFHRTESVRVAPRCSATNLSIMARALSPSGA